MAPWRAPRPQIVPPIPAAPVPDQKVDDTEVVPTEAKDSRRDKDLTSLLKSLQPKAFIGKGINIPKDLDECIISMGDYLGYTGYNVAAQALMGQAKLSKLAKTWWKINCHLCNITKSSQS